MFASPPRFLRYCWLVTSVVAAIPCSFGQSASVAPVNHPPVQATTATEQPSTATGTAQIPETATATVPPVQAPSSNVNPLPATAQPAALPAGLGAANGDYILKSGDTLDMVIYREPDLSIRSRIGKDGMIQLPLLGEIKLAGMTVRNATTLIRNRYNADYLVDPEVYLNIAAYNANKFTIIGQVNKPGAYEFSGSEPLGMLEAIGMAGGFTRIADRGHVIVKRREGNSVRTMKINAKKLADTGVDRFEIQSGDVINVGESWY